MSVWSLRTMSDSKSEALRLKTHEAMVFLAALASLPREEHERKIDETSEKAVENVQVASFEVTKLMRIDINTEWWQSDHQESDASA